MYPTSTVTVERVNAYLYHAYADGRVLGGVEAGPRDLTWRAYAYVAGHGRVNLGDYRDANQAIRDIAALFAYAY